jgi:hypothetical protein
MGHGHPIREAAAATRSAYALTVQYKIHAEVLFSSEKWKVFLYCSIFICLL